MARLKSGLESGLAVLEAKWSDRTNLSIRGFFDVLADLHFRNRNAYMYEGFRDAGSFRGAIVDIASRRPRDIRYIYIGAHGTPKGLEPHGGYISQTKIRNTLERLPRGSIKGIYFGSCLFVEDETVKFLLQLEKEVKISIKWIAGYSTPVPWIESSVLDILFWDCFFDTEGPVVKRIEQTASEINSLVPRLVEQLGFGVYVRKRGKKRGIKNFLGEDLIWDDLLDLWLEEKTV